VEAVDERDGAQEWLLPAHRVPPTVAELELRIDEALATARASEAAVMTVGAAALDAAEQARRAAELAELASAAMNRAVAPSNPSARSDGGAMDGFSARADRISERLQKLQRLPLGGTSRVRGATAVREAP
jgi:hypothetical protein